MWASCCGLLNEVMGTGAVRGQQPGFGGGANPFRFAPSTDFTVYTSAAAGANIVCKACGLSFSVFRKRVSSFRGHSESPLGDKFVRKYPDASALPLDSLHQTLPHLLCHVLTLPPAFLGVLPPQPRI